MTSNGKVLQEFFPFIVALLSQRYVSVSNVTPGSFSPAAISSEFEGKLNYDLMNNKTQIYMSTTPDKVILLNKQKHNYSLI